jgi:hypothetical protein
LRANQREENFGQSNFLSNPFQKILSDPDASPVEKHMTLAEVCRQIPEKCARVHRDIGPAIADEDSTLIHKFLKASIVPRVTRSCCLLLRVGHDQC